MVVALAHRDLAGFLHALCSTIQPYRHPFAPPLWPLYEGCRESTGFYALAIDYGHAHESEETTPEAPAVRNDSGRTPAHEARGKPVRAVP